MDRPSATVILLGNPGQEYALTRHNLGWWVGDILTEEVGISFRPGWGQFLSCHLMFDERPVMLVKPTTYMNLSGRVILQLSERQEVKQSDLIAVIDDIDLPLGLVRVRAGGSSGGHNGLASLIESLGSEDIARVRCGIGPVPEGTEPAEFVLAPFANNELSLATEMARRAAAAVRLIVTDGITAAANTYNRKPPAPESPSSDEAGADRPREGK